MRGFLRWGVLVAVLAAACATGRSAGAPTPTPIHARQRGVVIGVYNATTVPGLAHLTGNKLQRRGYVLRQVGDFPPSNTSFVYFRGGPQGRADAILLRDFLFQAAKVLALPGGTSHVPKSIELAVVLGADYASTHPAG